MASNGKKGNTKKGAAYSGLEVTVVKPKNAPDQVPDYMATDPNATMPTVAPMGNVPKATNAVNAGVGYLNQIDPHSANMFGNAAGILIDNGAVEAYNNARNNTINMTNRQYNDNARSYYQMYKQNQNRLGENLSRLGINGGASETAALNQLNNYSGNIYNNQQAKSNALDNINAEYDKIIAQNSADIASKLADMYYNLGSGLLAEKRQNQREDFLRGIEYKREDFLRNQTHDWEMESTNYDRALTQAQYTGDFSIMQNFGWSDKDVKNANDLFANGGSGSGSGSSGGGRSGGRSYSGYGGYGGSGGGDPDIDMTKFKEETGFDPTQLANGMLGIWNSTKSNFLNGYMGKGKGNSKSSGSNNSGKSNNSSSGTQSTGNDKKYRNLMTVIRNAAGSASALNKAEQAIYSSYEKDASKNLSKAQLQKLMTMLNEYKRTLGKKGGSGGGSSVNKSVNSQTYK